MPCSSYATSSPRVPAEPREHVTKIQSVVNKWFTIREGDRDDPQAWVLMDTAMELRAQTKVANETAAENFKQNLQKNLLDEYESMQKNHQFLQRACVQFRHMLQIHIIVMRLNMTNEDVKTTTKTEALQVTSTKAHTRIA